MTALAKAGQRQVSQVESTRDRPLYMPRFDIWETDDELLLCGDLPGVSSDELDITFENGELSIRGKVAPRNEDAEYLYREYGIGDYHRSFTIGEAIDSTKIAAELRDGVLTVHLPKTDKVKPRRIKVQSD